MTDQSNNALSQSNEKINAIALIELIKDNTSVNHYTQLNNYWESKARREGSPLQGILELTPYCNLDCKMCYVHMDRKKYPSEHLLPAKTWIQLIDEARDLGLLRLSLSGGECLTHPDFDEIYLHLYHRGIKTRVLTNGVLLDERRIAFFQRHPPNLIQITLYGSNEAEYEEVTGHRFFGNVLNNLNKLKESGLPVSISITPNPYMNQDYRALLKLAKNLDFPFQINSGLIDPRENTGRKGSDLSGDQYAEILKQRAEIMGQKLQPIDSACVPLPNTRIPDYPKVGILCGAGRSSFVIQYNGRLCACVGLTDITEEPLKLGFSKAWKSLNEKARNYVTPGECQACVYASQCALCPAAHKHAPQGHCDRRICERTVKLVSMGILRSPDMKYPCD